MFTSIFYEILVWDFVSVCVWQIDFGFYVCYLNAFLRKTPIANIVANHKHFDTRISFPDSDNWMTEVSIIFFFYPTERMKAKNHIASLIIITFCMCVCLCIGVTKKNIMFGWHLVHINKLNARPWKQKHERRKYRRKSALR